MMFLNIFRLWGLRVPLAYLLILGAGMGALGLWWAMFTSNLSGGGGFLNSLPYGTVDPGSGSCGNLNWGNGPLSSGATSLSTVLNLGE